MLSVRTLTSEFRYTLFFFFVNENIREFDAGKIIASSFGVLPDENWSDVILQTKRNQTVVLVPGYENLLNIHFGCLCE